jgi:hypothetical protein
MNAVNNSSPISRIIPILLIFTGLLGLYYLYQYLFGPRDTNSYSLISGKTSATIDSVKPIIITSDKLPIIYEGGEFTISTWIYISNWNYRRGFNKSIINIGGPNFDSIRVYLDGYKPSLSIRLHTKDGNNTNNTIPTSATANNMTTGTGAPMNIGMTQIESLDKNNHNSVFNMVQSNADLLNTSPICDLPQIDLQRWINITITVNGRTVDVYYDGKLARSCVLPSFFKVDAGGYSASLLAYGGFGGEIATTTMYDSALNPEQVFKNYMAGPEPITNIITWIKSFFAPGISVSIQQTK